MMFFSGKMDNWWNFDFPPNILSTSCNTNGDKAITLVGSRHRYSPQGKWSTIIHHWHHHCLHPYFVAIWTTYCSLQALSVQTQKIKNIWKSSRIINISWQNPSSFDNAVREYLLITTVCVTWLRLSRVRYPMPWDKPKRTCSVKY